MGRDAGGRKILGYHYEQAVRYHSELGRRRDEDVVVTAERASHWLGSAGRRGAGRGDVAAARKLLERSVRLAPDDGAKRAELELDLGLALTQSGEFSAADDLFARVVAGAADRGDRSIVLRGRIERMGTMNIAAPKA